MEQLEQKNMKFSEYMINCSVHNNQGLTSHMAVKMQQMINIVRDIAYNVDENDYIKKETLRQKADEFEGLFIPVPPQEKLQNLEDSISIFIERGHQVWESLK